MRGTVFNQLQTITAMTESEKNNIIVQYVKDVQDGKIRQRPQSWVQKLVQEVFRVETLPEGAFAIYNLWPEGCVAIEEECDERAGE